jgi:hypothetical protein
MTAAETGIYITLIALMYERREPLPSDTERLARMCGASKREFSAALKALIDDGKITIVDGALWPWVNGSWDCIGVRAVRRAIPIHVKREVQERDGNICQYCGDGEGPFHFDHVLPWSRGGCDTVENLVVACASCNLSKSDRTPSEMGWDQ